ncbi:hypothetical protein SAMN05216344_1013 [Polaromonas sp. OV174]|uniref:hypothetical protein n=1 Tax=Polaromonas sp. OV174 TaxID=1855300 RepID=UPI0008E09D4F|nr:hypothetical protein [Polaromonas sp. OV174]SFB66788.1 hypothetical protein SAMN05216344_1013 [Polaromonas sp. OV174]
MATLEKKYLDLLCLVATKGQGWHFGVCFSLSRLLTEGLAFASWHLVEKRAWHFNPGFRAA